MKRTQILSLLRFVKTRVLKKTLASVRLRDYKEPIFLPPHLVERGTVPMPHIIWGDSLESGWYGSMLTWPPSASNSFINKDR